MSNGTPPAPRPSAFEMLGLAKSSSVECVAMALSRQRAWLRHGAGRFDAEALTGAAGRLEDPDARPAEWLDSADPLINVRQQQEYDERLAEFSRRVLAPIDEEPPGDGTEPGVDLPPDDEVRVEFKRPRIDFDIRVLRDWLERLGQELPDPFAITEPGDG